MACNICCATFGICRCAAPSAAMMNGARSEDPRAGRPRAGREAEARSISPCASCRPSGARRCTRSMPSAARSTISPTMEVRAAGRIAMLDRWRADLARLYAGKGTTALTEGLAAPVKTFGSEAGGFPRRHRRHGDGRPPRHPRPDWEALRSLLRPRRLRGRPAFGQDLRDRGGEGTRPLAPSRPRPADDQYPARPR